MPRYLLYVCILGALAGCATQPAPSKLKVAEVKPLGDSPVYSLLVAEFAMQRDEPKIAYEHYASLAQKYRLPELAEQASYLAQYLGDAEAINASATLWHQLEPDSRVASNLLLDGLFQEEKYDQAFAILNQYDWQKNDAIYSILLSRVEQMPSESLDTFEKALKQQLRQHPNNPFYHLSSALVARHQQRMDAAHDQIDQALAIAPGLSQGILVKADILFHQKDFAGATRFLKKENAARPDPQLQDLLARAYLAGNEPQKALPVLQKLIKKQPENLEARFSLGRTQIQLARYEQAKHTFEELWDMAPNRSPLAFYLGYLAELQKQPQQALDYYQQVSQGDEFLTSRSRMIVLMHQLDMDEQIGPMLEDSRQESPDHAISLYLLEGEWYSKNQDYASARTLYTAALDESPSDPDLLYARAMLGEKDGNLDAMIEDLETLAALQPDNAQILNALGYTLTDQTDRHEEALSLLTRAHELKPNDAAIQDSLGWAYYHTEAFDDSLSILRQAYASFPDPEVAYHLGVVLWHFKQHKEATRIWRKALKKKPDYQPILDEMQRHGIRH
ncbi:tetratricopeptide repeat protein [Pokkaliibacter sp. CJK22405]|uniref:tetratricopeptide repeat protein n=1 Tax=Pokkaliibacter sp. CJK22405 TaxID=3384615 RepID=UPI003984F64B